MSDTEPTNLESEYLTKHCIAVDKASIDQKLGSLSLGPLSRIDFSRRYIVEHTVKVINIGKVSKDSMVYLMTHFRSSQSAP
jgi:hypothetical protein